MSPFPLYSTVASALPRYAKGFSAPSQLKFRVQAAEFDSGIGVCILVGDSEPVVLAIAAVSSSNTGLLGWVVGYKMSRKAR